MAKKQKRGYRARPAPPQYPVPEALDGAQWDISKSSTLSGATNPLRRSMTVPVSLRMQAKRTRDHEMAHAKWSPDRVPEIEGIDVRTTQVCEDVRMHTRLRRTGITSPDTPQMDERDAELLKQTLIDPDTKVSGLVELGQGLVANVGTGDHQSLTKAFKEAATECEEDGRYTRAKRINELLIPPRIVKKVMERSAAKAGRSLLPQFPDTIAAAEAVQPIFECLKDVKDKRDGGEPGDEPGEGGEGDGEKGDGEGELEDADGDTTMGEEIEDDGGFARGREEDVPWGKMTIEEPPLVVSHPGRWKTIKRRARDSGVIPVAMHRLPVDQRVFSGKARSKGHPTVLIDCSGSMGFSVANIKEMAEMFPFAKVAVYGGSARTGLLRIIVDKCRRAQDHEIMKRPGGLNVIDGPALVWLSKQPAPRLWVSDGFVTGIGDGVCAKLVTEAAMIRKYGKIARAACIDNALDTLRKYKGAN